MQFPRIKAGVVALCIVASGASAQSSMPDGVTLFALSDVLSLAQTDRAAALERIGELLPRIPNDRTRIRFDLFTLQAELQAQDGNLQDAAQLYAQLAQFAARNRPVLEEDPARFWSLSTELFERSGDLQTARDALLEMLDEQRGGAMGRSHLQSTLARIDTLTRAIGDDMALPYGLGGPEDTVALVDGTRAVGDEGGFREVDVYYATDRARSGAKDPDLFYGYGRGQLELGIAQVSIPDAHTPGAIEAPSIWKLEFSANPAKHVVLQSVHPLAADDFYKNMQGKLAGDDVSGVFVFVHGYNVSFDQAARRAAQLAYDTSFPGIPVLYSWPSRGSTAGYVADTAVVRLSGRRLSQFLDDLVARSGATTIHIVAHSMGNRALTDALELMALRRGLRDGDAPIFDQVLFAAPDVDADLFAEMMPTIRPVAKRLTLYASDQDWALATSRHLHGDAPRAGQGGADMMARPEFDSVDMSELGEDMLAHSYFAGDRSALADMVALFWRNAAPERRCGLKAQAVDGSDLRVWHYLKGICANSDLVNVIAHLQQARVQDMRSAEKVVAESVPDAEKAKAILPVVAKLMGD